MKSNNFKDLNDKDLLSVFGGSWISDFGAWSHEKWNEVQEWYDHFDPGSLPEGYSNGRNYGRNR